MAEILLIIHFLIILFVILGFPLGLFLNNYLFRMIHAAILGIITLLMILKIQCPITVLEEWATGVSYEGSFLAVWLNRIIYLPGFNPRYIFWMDMAFALLVFSSFLWFPLEKNKTR